MQKLILVRVSDIYNPLVYDVSNQDFSLNITENKNSRESVQTATIGDTIKIMPLGDSITWGVTPNNSNSPGYRRTLDSLLRSSNYFFNLVGSLKGGLPNDFDRDNEGHPGWFAGPPSPDQYGEHNIADSLHKFLNWNPPHVILLHIGTNDISETGTQWKSTPLTVANKVKDLLDSIYNFDSNIFVIVARIVNRNDPSPADSNKIRTSQYNNFLQQKADSLIALGRNIIVVNMEDTLLYPADIEAAVPYVHPVYSGYQKMSGKWYYALTKILPVIQLKIFLQGPYAGSGLMGTLLRTNNLIPAISPYGDYNNPSPFLNGSNHIVVPYTIPNNITDWVQVEVRSINGTTIIKSKSCLLRNDGQVIDPYGLSKSISLGITSGSYYVVVRHRNHLAIMSSDLVQLNGLTTYNFTTAQTKAYGFNSMADLGDGNYGMISGDGNGNGQIQNNDSETIWKQANGTNGYINADYNLNGQVQNNDNETFWKPNNGKASQVP